MKKVVFGYFIDKFRGTDQRQVESLPKKTREALLFGSEEDYRKAIEAVRTRERFLRTTILGSAAMELIYDTRASREIGKERKG